MKWNNMCSKKKERNEEQNERKTLTKTYFKCCFVLFLPFFASFVHLHLYFSLPELNAYCSRPICTNMNYMCRMSYLIQATKWKWRDKNRNKVIASYFRKIAIQHKHSWISCTFFFIKKNQNANDLEKFW